MMIGLMMAAALPLAVPSAPWINGGKAPDAPENICQGYDWMNDAGLRCACYDPDGNILLNPSFESGGRYWCAQKLAPHIEDLYSTNVVRSGRHSLRLDKGRNYHTACVVLAADTDYTLSFYLHSDENAKGGSFGYQANGRGTRGASTPVTRGWLPVSNGWHRVVQTFHTGKTLQETTFWFCGGDCYLDDVQVERGTAATEYRGNPFALEILLDSPERTYCDARKDSKPRIRLAGPAGATGKLKVKVTDFFQREVFSAAKRFKLGKTGEVFLPIDDRALPKGPLVAAVRVEPLAERAAPLQGDQSLRDWKPFQEYLRWTKIDYLDNTHLHKDLMLLASKDGKAGDPWTSEHCFRRMAHFGLGGWNYGAVESEADKALLDKYNLSVFDAWLTAGSRVLRTVTLNGRPYKWDGVYYENMTNFPDAFLRWNEDNVAEWVAKRPWTTNWTMMTEPTSHFVPLRDFVVGDRDEYAKYILSNYRGVKRGNPNAVMNPYGDWNMFEGGRRNIADMLLRVRRLDPKAPDYFPVIEVHSYRQRPIVEKDLTGFFDDLARAGYPDIKVRIGEGSYYYPMWRQSYDIQRGVGPKDDYQNASAIVVPSYDIGWGERFSAMCVTRETLNYYRHADRVSSNCSWNPGWIAGGAPIAWLSANNALANLLGNATFLKEIRFATDAQAFVFDDAAGRTVAAVWREDWDFDCGKVPGTTMEMPKVKGMEILDLMGNRCSIEQSNNPNNRTLALPLSGFVVYLRVPNERRAELVKALEGAKSAADAEKCPILVDYAVKDAATDEIVLENPLSHVIGCTLEMNGRREKVTVPAGERKRFATKLEKPAAATESQRIVRSATVTTDAGAVQAVAFTNLVSAIPYAASPIDWSKVPSVKGGRCDRTYAAEWKKVEVDVRRAWNEKEIAFRFDVTDSCAPAYASEKEFGYEQPGTGACRTRGVRAILYVDPFCDAGTLLRHGLGKSLGWDDYMYSAVPTNASESVCFRHVAPDAQLAGGAIGAFERGVEPNVKTSFRVRPGGYVYEIVIPAWYAMPLKLKEGTVFGLAYDLLGGVDSKGAAGTRWHDNLSWYHNAYAPVNWNPTVLVK